MTQIGTVIATINDLQATIAAAVEEQSAASAEISRANAEVTMGTTDIAQSISSVAERTHHTSGGAVSVRTAADELAELAARLDVLVNQFQVRRTTTAVVDAAALRQGASSASRVEPAA